LYIATSLLQVTKFEYPPDRRRLLRAPARKNPGEFFEVALHAHPGPLTACSITSVITESAAVRMKPSATAATLLKRGRLVMLLAPAPVDAGEASPEP
jgi:hypothetical protein